MNTNKTTKSKINTDGLHPIIAGILDRLSVKPTTENVFHLYPNWPQGVDYNSPAGWEVEKQIALNKIKEDLKSRKPIEIDNQKAKIQCGIIIGELDNLATKFFLEDIYGADVKSNKSEAFHALEKAVAAFRELVNKF